MNKQLIKKILILSCLTLIPFFLTGCTNRSTSSNTQTLTVWRQPTNKKLDDQVFASLISAFEKQNPGVRVEYRSFEATEDYEAAVINALATNTRPDVWEIRNDELARHLSKLTPYPTSSTIDVETMRKGQAATIADEMVANGQLYGLPMGIDPLVLYVNQDHLQEAQIQNLPRTWDDVVNTATALTRKVGTTIFRPGLAMGTTSNVDRSNAILEALMLQLKTQMTDPTNKNATFNLYTQRGDNQFSYPGRDALAFYTSFADPNSPLYTWNANQPYSTEAFATGNLSMMFNYFSIGVQLQEVSPELNFVTANFPQRLVKRFPYGDLPGGVDAPIYTARYRALVASKPWEGLSEDQQAIRRNLSWSFISFMAAPNISSQYSQAVGLFPVTIPTQNANSLTSAGQANNTLATVLSNLKTWYRGRSPRSVDRIMNDMIGTVSEAGVPIETAVDKAAELTTQILQ